MVADLANALEHRADLADAFGRARAEHIGRQVALPYLEMGGAAVGFGEDLHRVPSPGGVPPGDILRGGRPISKRTVA